VSRFALTLRAPVRSLKERERELLGRRGGGAGGGGTPPLARLARLAMKSPAGFHGPCAFSVRAPSPGGLTPVMRYEVTALSQAEEALGHQLHRARVRFNKNDFELSETTGGFTSTACARLEGKLLNWLSGVHWALKSNGKSDSPLDSGSGVQSKSDSSLDSDSGVKNERSMSGSSFSPPQQRPQFGPPSLVGGRPLLVTQSLWKVFR
jgi:hypothetical protein